MTPMPGDLLFPTMVVGSLPRPQWVKELIEERKSGQVSPTQADQLLDSVIPSALSMQERAGDGLHLRRRVEARKLCQGLR